MSYATMIGSVAAAVTIATAAVYAYETGEEASEAIVAHHAQVWEDYAAETDALLASIRD